LSFEQRIKSARPKIVLDGPAAKGLLGDSTIGGEGVETPDELPSQE
jgi:hypothetical protein